MRFCFKEKTLKKNYQQFCQQRNRLILVIKIIAQGDSSTVLNNLKLLKQSIKLHNLLISINLITRSNFLLFK